jgi:hypothetical protein
LTDDAVVYKLACEAKEFRIDRVVIMIIGAEMVERPVRATAAAASSHEAAAVDRAECDDDQELYDYFAKVDAPADSECESLCSSNGTSIDSNVDSDADVASDSSDEVQLSKKAYGSCVVYSNGYFTFTDNPDFPDVKVKALENGAGQIVWELQPRARRLFQHISAKIGLHLIGQ